MGEDGEIIVQLPWPQPHHTAYFRPLLVPYPKWAGEGGGAALPVLFADCQGFIFGVSPQRGPQGRLKDKQGFKS